MQTILLSGTGFFFFYIKIIVQDEDICIILLNAVPNLWGDIRRHVRQL